MVQTPKPFTYKARITEVIDGDTCRADIDLGFSIVLERQVLRLLGINTPELRSKDTDMVTKANQAKDWLTGVVQGRDVIVTTIKDKREKYGRMLAVIHVPDQTVSVNDQLVTAGLAVKQV